jgi:phosphatidylserine/phosphatidylglycerophosphate/cardiolipin synthase-like enzyme/uncharacterized membrane protein YdjX (TVP38/TMEM64 family)
MRDHRAAAIPKEAPGVRQEGRESLFSPGHNCWRVERAQRVSFLVDGESYFQAFAEALERAQRRVMVTSWDFHGGTSLHRSGGDDLALGPFLHQLVSRRKHLQVHVLNWDFSMLFALDRDWAPLLGNGTWLKHRRVHFRFDDCHPLGASHHQKVVVVDDAVAFVGGLDLTQRRWDTREHLPGDIRRRDPGGRLYGPFHDAQILVDGEAAAALGELVRERWRAATGERVPPCGPASLDPWPPSFRPDMENVPVALSRTIPDAGTGGGTREVEQLYLDSIRAARRFLYFENQYFTSAAIARAIENRLREPRGPEVVMVLPRECPGWLEERTMGFLRARLLERLRGADEHGRFRACYPVTSGDCAVGVHSKVLVVDDRLVRVGSSNLSNRSMGLDTECDAAIESNGSRETAEAIATFRNRLLGEHLGTGEKTVAALLRSEGSLTAIVDRFRDRPRCLRPIEPDLRGWDLPVSTPSIFDPDGPETPKRLVREFVGEDVPQSAGNPWVRILAVLGLLLSLAAIWRWTPLLEWIDPRSIALWAREVQGNPWAPLFVAGFYLLASLLLLPITVLVLATAIAFDPWPAVLYSFAGSLIAGHAGFALGRVLARDTVRRMAGSYPHRFSRLLGRRGLTAVIALRLLPIAPFTVANVIAGASHVKWRDFALGTAIGLAPGILAVNLFETQVEGVIDDPHPLRLFFLAVLLALIVLGVAWTRRTFRSLEKDAA